MRRTTPPSTRQRWAVPALAAGLLAVSSCGGAGAALDTPDGGSSVETVAGVGRLPATIPAATVGGEIDDEEIAVGVTLPPLEGEEIGTVAAGNRLLMVGDSLFAGLSRRFSDKACLRLNPLGWDVLVEAEPGRFVDFGRRVLDRRLDEGWDALVFMFGSNYRSDRTSFQDTLGGMIADAGDVPVVLLTTSLFRDAQREVNEVITTFGLFYDNVTIVDWEGLSAIPGVLSRDRLHPTDQGQEVMVAAIAQVLGDAPPAVGEEGGGEEVGESVGDGVVQAGECLRAQFTDDSAIGRGTGTGSPTGTSPPGTRPPGTSPPGTSPPPTTAAPTGTPPPSSDAPVTAPPSTSPPPTAPPATNPPATSPPATSPPATSPPATSPPATSPPATSPPEPSSGDDG